MTERGLDNVRIATKVLLFFVVPLGVLFLLHLTGAVPMRHQPGVEEQIKPSMGELIFSGLYFLLLFATFVMPLLVLRRELHKRRTRE